VIRLNPHIEHGLVRVRVRARLRACACARMEKVGQFNRFGWIITIFFIYSKKIDDPTDLEFDPIDPPFLQMLNSCAEN